MRRLFKHAGLLWMGFLIGGVVRPACADLTVYGPEDLEHVAQELNGRPRKTLDWDTPAERLHVLLTT